MNKINLILNDRNKLFNTPRSKIKYVKLGKHIHDH